MLRNFFFLLKSASNFPLTEASLYLIIYKECGVKIMFMVIGSCAESGLSNYTSIVSSVPRMPKGYIDFIGYNSFLHARTS